MTDSPPPPPSACDVAVKATLRNLRAGLARRRTSIGIPQALFHFLHPGLWETFFRELGLRVVLSGPTRRATLERAGLISESEHCLPVKLLDAHLAALVGQVDLLFVPRILSTVAGCIACPKLGALPDAVAAQFGQAAALLTVDVDTARIPLAESLRRLGRSLKADAGVLRAAVEAALRALRASHAAERAAAPAPGGRRFLLIGHPYNLRDEHLCGPILRKLEALGAPVERLVHDAERLDGGPLRWDACAIQHEALQRLHPATCAGVLQLSSFNCGCDSIAGEIFRVLLRKKRIPYMTLILDEHAAQTGIDTRLEAFVDSTRWA